MTWFRGRRSEDNADVVVGGAVEWGSSAVEDGLVTCDYAEARTEYDNNAEIMKVAKNFFKAGVPPGDPLLLDPRGIRGEAHRAFLLP